MDKLDVKLIFLILIMNFVIGLTFFIMGFFKEKNQQKTLNMLGCFIIIVPLFGILYIVLSQLLLYSRRNIKVDMNDVSFSREREKLIISPDRDIEINFVPIEDAIMVSDKKSLRKLLLDTMLRGNKKTLSSISVALSSDDSETSHYVASLIMELLSTARTKIQTLVDKLNKNQEDVELNLELFNYICEILDMNIMAEVEKETYIYLLNDITNILFEKNLWYLTAKHYLKIIDLFISIHDFNMAHKWLNRAVEYRKDDLETYKGKLHFYFAQNDNIAFIDTLNELRNTDLIADDEIMNLFHLYK